MALIYRGAPGVIIQYKTIMPERESYGFITSIIIESERGPIDTPIIVNSITEFDYYFGNTKTESRRYVLSFLQYSPSLLVQRSVKSTPSNALPTDPGTYNASSASETTPYDKIRIDNLDKFNELNEADFLNGNIMRIIARTPGKLGNNTKVAMFTVDHYRSNVLVYSTPDRNYYAKDLTSEFDELYYCVCIFTGNNLVETFNVPFTNISKINEYSNEIYLATAFPDIDNNTTFDGDIRFHDGNFGYFDGNVFNPLSPSYSFFGNSIITLSGGESLKPDFNDYLESTSVINEEGYEIDIHIAWNVSLNRNDVVNIVSSPVGVRQAIDYIDVYNTLYTDDTPKMFIYGIKTLDKQDMGLCADYAGLRSRTVLTQGLGVSSSKISIPFNLNRLKTNPTKEEMDLLYYNKINAVHKYKGIYYCDGELLS